MAFGDEWEALGAPEFLLFINALDDFIAIQNIRSQTNSLFKSSPRSAQWLYEARAEEARHGSTRSSSATSRPVRQVPGRAEVEGVEPHYRALPQDQGLRRRAHPGRREGEGEEPPVLPSPWQCRSSSTSGAFHQLRRLSLLAPRRPATPSTSRWLPFVRRASSGGSTGRYRRRSSARRSTSTGGRLSADAHRKRYPFAPTEILFHRGRQRSAGGRARGPAGGALSLHTLRRRLQNAHDADRKARLDEVRRATPPQSCRWRRSS